MSIVYLTAALLVTILGGIIGIEVFLANRKNLVNKLFGAFSLITSIWIVVDYSLYLSRFASIQTTLNRINLSVITAMIFILAWFVTVFPKPIFNLKKWILYLFGLWDIGLILITLFSKSIINYAFMESYGSNFKQGNMFFVFAINVTIVALYSVIILIIKYFKLKNEEKQQIKFMLYGIGILSLLNLIFNLFIPMITNSFEFARFGTYSALFFIAFTAYAIMRTQLFDVKVILTEAAVIIINVISAIQIFTSNSLIETFLRSIFMLVIFYGSVLLVRSIKNEIRQKDELRLIAKKLDKANMDLEQLDEAKDNFLSMAAHELNTPIAAIEGYLSMILEEKMGGKVPAKMLGYLQNVFLSSKRLAGLVHDLLNVSRIESNRIHIVYTQEQIEDVIDHSISEVKIKADEVGHKLIFEKPAKPLPKTYIDMPRIVEVLINIIGNAIKYTEPPGKIEVKCHADDGKIVVSIEDNGRGIPKDKYDHVFEKFTQVNVLTDQVKGTGLGMFISKNLIELHKGKLWFTSSVDPKDHGTTFYFSLPILKDKPFDPHEGEGALLQTGGQKTDAAKPEEGKIEGSPASASTEDKKQDESQERLENMVEKQTGGKTEDKTAPSTTNSTSAPANDGKEKASEKTTKPSLGSKLEAEIPTDIKKAGTQPTKSQKQDKASEKLIKDAVEEAEKAPTTSLNETMSKLK